MRTLYPLKFTPLYKRKIWGGNKLHTLLNKDVEGADVGESWEISGVQDNISVVSNGFLEGNSLEELIEVYMGELVGDSIYEKYGVEFPILIKFIDANHILSVQVHPDDSLAKERHNAYGKTEMWYVVEAKENAELIVGFNKPITKEQYLYSLKNGELKEILNVEKVKKTDCFFLPAGRIHSIGAGILIAEIQQTSDITYRIFDWNRVDKNGEKRELHTDLALDAIDFDCAENYKKEYVVTQNTPSELVSCRDFTTNILHISDSLLERDYLSLDSFVVYMCVEGSVEVETSAGILSLKLGETVLVPACLDWVKLSPREESRLLEVFIK